MAETTTLRGISEIRGFFRTNQTPIYFVSPTAFNLLGIDRWVRNFFFVNYFDSFEGSHPRVFVPEERPYREFELHRGDLQLPARSTTRCTTSSRSARARRQGASFVFFDEETEALAAEAGLEVALPSAELRHRLDSKIVTTRLGDEAGRAERPERAGTRPRATTELLALAAGRRPGRRPGRADPVRRLGQDDLLRRREERDWDDNAEEMVDARSSRS